MSTAFGARDQGVALCAALERLLGTEGSLLASLTAAGLDGLRGTLLAALAAAPDDPGAGACAALLAELDTLRTARPVSAPVRQPGAAPPVSAQPPRERASGIESLAEALAKSPAVADFAAGAVPPGQDGPADEDALRRWFHLTLLRLPERHAAPWRRRAVQEDPLPDELFRTLPGWTNGVLLPPSHDGRRGIRTHRLESAGLRELAELVLALGEFDEGLCHLLDGLWTGGSALLADSEVRATYRTELNRRLEVMERTPRHSADRLRACVFADEALCSVMHLPPAAAGSWWHRFAEESHGIALALARETRAAGEDVELVLPAVPYRDARRHTQNDDIRLTAGGRPGETLACLRLWLRVGDQVFPGRVVHRAVE
ncbi:hypothetical protein [Streptomyces sp. NPDC001530]|uniref:hypothetical protein n=1 Tax=Streptomyces sp. NPDC001530 TaxID=3364582 RepID=UPI003674BC5A